MQYEGDPLAQILRGQTDPVQVYDSYNSCRGEVVPRTATRMAATGLFVGVGNRRRIRYLRPLGGAINIGQLHGASHNVQRPRNDQGIYFAPGWVVEHKKQHN